VCFMRYMKNILLLILFIFGLFAFASNAKAEDCPLGLINDTAPGSCALYIDKNADALCDLSQPTLNDSCDTNLTATDLTSTEIKSMTVEQVAEYYKIEGEKFATELSKVAGIKVKKSDSFQVLHDSYAVRPVTVREIAVSMQSNSSSTITTTVTPTQNHYIILIVLLSTILYTSTWILSKKEKISPILHKKIWNWLLLVVFVPTLITSLLWLFRIEWGIIIRVPFNIEYWHIIFGMIMIMISIFHIIWHINYYKLKK
jgi:hypothetical protein